MMAGVRFGHAQRLAQVGGGDRVMCLEFSAHNLSVVKHVSGRVAVMYLGRIVELAATEGLFAEPKHPYTEALLSAVPVPEPDYSVQRIILVGDVPSPVAPPPGCHFHPRCRYAVDICRTEDPKYEAIQEEHFVACHRAAELSLQPVKSG